MSSEHKSINFSLISKYRAALMGAAIIMIMFCHLDTAQTRNGLEITRLAKLLHTNTVGVDIFMFLSGVGLYYSFSNKQQSYIQFEKRRLKRVIPLYILIAGITYLLYDLIINRLSFWKFLRDLTFISWFRDDSILYWYILAISVFYLLFPLLYRMIHSGRHGALKTAVFCVLWWTFTELLFFNQLLLRLSGCLWLGCQSLQSEFIAESCPRRGRQSDVPHFHCLSS